MSGQDQEQQTKQALLAGADEVERMGETIVRAAEGRRPFPTEMVEALKKIADLTSECGEAMGEHLDQTYSKETLEAVVAALNAIRSGIDSVVIFKALEGTAYETRTVAND